MHLDILRRESDYRAILEDCPLIVDPVIHSTRGNRMMQPPNTTRLKPVVSTCSSMVFLCLSLSVDRREWQWLPTSFSDLFAALNQHGSHRIEKMIYVFWLTNGLFRQSTNEWSFSHLIDQPQHNRPLSLILITALRIQLQDTSRIFKLVLFIEWLPFQSFPLRWRFMTMLAYRSRRFIRHVLIDHQSIYKSLSTVSSPSSLPSAAQNTPRKVDLMMKQLIDSRRYKDALDLFEKQSQISTDITMNLALKACTKLNDRERGVRIHQRLSPTSRNNPFIQASLLHFYSEWQSPLLLTTLTLINAGWAERWCWMSQFLLNRCLIICATSVWFRVQSGDLDRAQRLFSTIDKKTTSMYSAMFKGEFCLAGVTTNSLFDLQVTFPMESLNEYLNYSTKC